jgi:ligand-binding SRPBCC domain-containing protein
MRLHLLQREQTVRAARDDVFAFFAKPENLAELTPASLGFQILTPAPIVMREGALIDYVLRLNGLPLHWRTVITSYEPPHRFVDEQLAGPYAFWHHTHTFDVTPEGGTRLGDVVRYALPLGLVGDLAHALVVRRQLQGIFEYRREIIARRFAPDPTGK